MQLNYVLTDKRCQYFGQSNPFPVLSADPLIRLGEVQAKALRANNGCKYRDRGQL